MGSQQQSLDVIFDNASDWLVLEGKDCINCEGSTYNIYESTAAKQVSTEFSQRMYGNTVMTGIEWTDQVCVTSAACINDFEFFLIQQ